MYQRARIYVTRKTIKESFSHWKVLNHPDSSHSPFLILFVCYKFILKKKKGREGGSQEPDGCDYLGFGYVLLIKIVDK